MVALVIMIFLSLRLPSCLSMELMFMFWWSGASYQLCCNDNCAIELLSFLHYFTKYNSIDIYHHICLSPLGHWTSLLKLQVACITILYRHGYVYFWKEKVSPLTNMYIHVYLSVCSFAWTWSTVHSINCHRQNHSSLL